MPAGEENDPRGVPFLVAPIKADDPKEKKPTDSKQREDDNVIKAKAELKQESDELVSHLTHYRIAGRETRKLTRPRPRSSRCRVKRMLHSRENWKC